MRICHVSKRCCIRVSKIAAATKYLGHSTELLCQRIPYMGTCFEVMSIYLDDVQLKQEVENSRADIFHVHNEPDRLVRQVKEAAGNRPVLHDCHDLESLVHPEKPPSDQEKDAFQYADGIVHVSHAQKAAAEQVHGNSKLTIVFPSLVPAQFMPEERDLLEPNWKGICYEGGLMTTDKITRIHEDGQSEELRSCRSLHDVVKAFTEQGYIFYLFSAMPIPIEETAYFQVGGVVIQTMLYPALLQAMRLFGFGFCGAPSSMRIMEVAMPNKLFEYMSQGVVPVIFNSAESSRFVAEENIGITIASLADLPNQLARGPEIRENILKYRFNMAMENHIHKLITFYEAAIDGHKGGIDENSNSYS